MRARVFSFSVSFNLTMFMRLFIYEINISFCKDSWSYVFFSSIATILSTYFDIYCLFLSFSFTTYKILFYTSILSCSSSFSNSSFFSFILWFFYYILPKSSSFSSNFLFNLFIYLSHRSFTSWREFYFSFIRWFICFSLSSWIMKISLFFLSTNSFRFTCKFSTSVWSLSFSLTFEYFRLSYYSVFKVKASLYFLSWVSMTSISDICEFFMLLMWR